MSAICPHENFDASVEVARVESTAGGPMRYMAHVQVRCAQCKTRFAFQGVDCGLMWDRPMVSPPGFELRAPIEPDAHATSMLGGHPDTAFPV